MICLIRDNTVVFGPAPWSLSAILEPLIVAGFDLMEGTLYGPDKAAICPFSSEPPQGALALSGGFTLLPTMELNEPAPEGKMLAGREPVILEDHVGLRPVWADIPPTPPPPAPAPKIEFTKTDFLDLFTVEEQIALKGLEKTDDAVALFWERYRVADNIRLDDPRTIGAINMLAAAGHITLARAAAILED